MSEPANKFLVLGTGGHSRFVIDTIRQAGGSIEGVISLDEVYDSNEKILGHRILGYEADLITYYATGNRNIILAVGSNITRQHLYDKWRGFGFSFPSIIHPSSTIASSAKLGEANIIGPNVIVGANVELGNNNILNSSCLIEHESIIGDHCHIAPGVVVCGRVIVGNHVFLGANSTVIEKLRVANSTLLGAGSTLVESNHIIGRTLVGSPARHKK